MQGCYPLERISERCGSPGRNGPFYISIGARLAIGYDNESEMRVLLGFVTPETRSNGFFAKCYFALRADAAS